MGVLVAKHRRKNLLIEGSQPSLVGLEYPFHSITLLFSCVLPEMGQRHSEQGLVQEHTKYVAVGSEKVVVEEIVANDAVVGRAVEQSAVNFCV